MYLLIHSGNHVNLQKPASILGAQDQLHWGTWGWAERSSRGLGLIEDVSLRPGVLWLFRIMHSLQVLRCKWDLGRKTFPNVLVSTMLLFWSNSKASSYVCWETDGVSKPCSRQALLAWS